MPAVNAVKKPRVSLDIQSGRLGGPITYFLYGVEGIGKSTFAADSPAPVFIDVERGTRELNVARLVEPEGGWTWLDVLDSIRLLETETHAYKTLAIDTADELEALLWAYICDRDKKAGIEDYGFGKGYQAALDEWRVFVAALERLRTRRGMNVALIAHTVVRTFKNPEGEDYDRYQPRIHDKAAGLLKGKSDVVLFANWETYANKKDTNSKVERAKGVSTGNRVIYTRRTAAYDAKNRHELPEQMKLDAKPFFEAIRRFQTMTPSDLKASITTAIPKMPETMRADAIAALGRADSEQKLAQLLGWIRENTPA